MPTTSFEPLYASIIDHVDNGIVLLDPMNSIVIWNQFMEKHSGVKSQDIVGNNLFDVFPDLPRTWLELKLKSVKLLKSYSFISWTQRPSLFKLTPKDQLIGDSLEVMFQDSTFFPVVDQRSGDTGVCIVIKDVTDMVKASRQIEEMKDVTQTLANIANYDTLTAVFTRSYIEKQLKVEFNRASRYHSDFSLILFDIDHFKKINDSYGHLAGDEVLKQVCSLITRNLRDSDIFGRFGGEEFIIILPNATEETARIVTEKLRRLVEELTTRFEEFTIQITISQGFVQYNESIKDYFQMIHEADLAMYHAKKSGRNRTSQFKANECLAVISEPSIPQAD
ncbi:GGDEF domain-containing protein [Desulfoluna limicola]|uniref:diguanylate cyclase n=1 Tax=Desulfoluna limicola TaxID=2810562 RepID=A0ABM7PJ64_9BACT|nr:sensor domain-containing diguanylate cyclase [Desulfoluna limicola]BCS97597.1 GGDEF domain-containing protein [Desulfoluna limicola]